jgi:hypothetical protein
MTITLYMPPAAGLFDSSGDPLSGGLVNTYVSGTTTAKNSYPTQDDAAAQTNANANPVVLDSNGRAQIWLDGVYKIVVTDSAGSTIQTVDEYGLVTDADVYDKQYLQGLEVTLDTDTDHDVNVTAGEARDVSDTSDIVLTGEITKRVDATWAVGDDNGGLDTSTVAATSIYYIWLIQRSDTGVEDVLISLSASAPTMPTSYDKKRLIGVGKTDGSSNWTFVSKAGWTDYHNCIFPDSATTDAYAVAPQPVHAQYFTGMRVRFRAATLNTAASTLNLNGLGNKALEYNGDAVVTGDIIANQIVEAEYDGTAFQMLTPPNILDVAQGGSGVASLTDGGILLGSGTGDITAFGVLSDSNFLVGDGATDPVAESGDTARISMGVGSSDSPTFTGLTTTGHTQRSLETGITAGTTQTMAGAAALTKDINIVTVVGSDDDGVALPTAVAGKEITIKNSDSAQRLQVWPGNGFSDTIDGGSANAVDANKLAAGDVRAYFAVDATNWHTKIHSSASATASGIVELATTVETTTGADAARVVTPEGLHDMTSLSGAVWMLDEDNMATDSNTKVASQQSIKAYVDAAGGDIGTNLLRNPAMQINERETLGVYTSATKHTNVDTALTLDGWAILSDGNDRVDVSQESSVVPNSGDMAMKLDVESVSGTSEKFGICQILESQYCSSAVGQTCTLSFKARTTSGTVENLRAHILSWDGTADAPTRDVVNAWNAEGSNPTFATNWTAENTASNIAIDNAYDTYSVSGAVDTAGTVNIAVFIHVDDTDLAAGNLLYITDVKLEIGSSATTFVYGGLAAGADRYWCKRYYEKFTSASTNDPYFAGGWKESSTQALAMFYYQEKRTIPSVAFSTVTDYSLTSADGENGASTGITAPDPGFFGVRLTFTDSAGPFSTNFGAFFYIERHASEKWIEVSAEF